MALVLVMLAIPLAMAADNARHASERLGPSATSRRDDPAAALQQRLKDRVAKGISIDTYAVALAQAWLDYARESYFRKDRLAQKEAMGEAKAVIETLESQGAEARVDARVTASSSRLRDDLWLKAASLKQHADFACATWHTARLEIALVAAGRANNDMGWRAARPFVRRAERLAAEADSKLVACAATQPTAVNTAPPVGEKIVQPEIPKTLPEAAKAVDSASIPRLPDRVHFGRESAELSDVSALVLEQVSYVMRANSVIVLELRGYAYELGSADKNSELALGRAQAVKDYLVETGIGKERLMLKPEPAVATEGLSSVERAKLRRVELVPTQSETVPIEYQEKDLSTEGPSGS